jgi:hypothetical protein
MRPRFIVRRLRDENLYSVWDTKNETAAVYDGRICTGLDMEEAFNLADFLNTQDALPKEK